MSGQNSRLQGTVRIVLAPLGRAFGVVFFVDPEVPAVERGGVIEVFTVRRFCKMDPPENIGGTTGQGLGDIVDSQGGTGKVQGLNADRAARGAKDACEEEKDQCFFHVLPPIKSLLLFFVPRRIPRP